MDKELTQVTVMSMDLYDGYMTNPKLHPLALAINRELPEGIEAAVYEDSSDSWVYEVAGKFVRDLPAAARYFCNTLAMHRSIQLPLTLSLDLSLPAHLPVFWPPKPGDLWKTEDGETWFARENYSRLYPATLALEPAHRQEHKQATYYMHDEDDTEAFLAMKPEIFFRDGADYAKESD